jgi:rod shape-determining protein MreC
VYDKTVRRRRAVLGLLVACSLILLTAYFGEGGSGSLHAIQRGVVSVVSPIQDVASRALSPVRDLFSWVGDTFHAKGEVNGLRKQNGELVKENIQLHAQLIKAEQIAGLKSVDVNAGLAGTKPLNATVIAASPSEFEATVNIDAGSSDGVRDRQPVIGADDSNGALIGAVTNVWADGAQVTLITDQTSFVTAEDVDNGFRSGVQPAVGNPNGLTLLDPSANIGFKRGDLIATSGICSAKFPSLYPPNIPIGTVAGVDNAGTANQVVRVKPLVNLQRVQNVQVLRTPQTDSSQDCSA